MSIQNYGYGTFFIRDLRQAAWTAMNWVGGEMYAYKETGGSNLDMEDECYDVAGEFAELGSGYLHQL